jgi:RNA polymerase sigma-70 factor, ECF subfamily
MLAEDVEVHSDGGGLRPAALNVIAGRANVIALFTGLARKFGDGIPLVLHLGTINAAPGFATLEPDGLPQTVSLELEDGLIKRIFVMRNPEKLRHLPFVTN